MTIFIFGGVPQSPFLKKINYHDLYFLENFATEPFCQFDLFNEKKTAFLRKLFF